MDYISSVTERELREHTGIVDTVSVLILSCFAHQGLLNTPEATWTH